MQNQLEQVKDSIVVLRPTYGPMGDSTELWTAKGMTVDRRSIRSLKKALARLYAIDLSAQGEKVAEIIDRQTVLPFYLQPERVFIPLKMRSAMYPNDRCCGYVDVGYIETISPEKGTVRLLLKDGRFIELLCTAATAAQTICIGQRLSSCLQPNRSANEEDIIVKAAALVLQRLKILENILNKVGD